MSATIRVSCPHCGWLSEIRLAEPVSLPGVALPTAPEPPRSAKPKGMCACGHDGSHHVDGPCDICKHSVVGAVCEKFHSRALRDKKPRAAPAATNGTMATSDRRVLTALVQLRGVGSREKLAILSGYSLTSSGFSASLTRLRDASAIEGHGEDIRLTKHGKDIAGDVDPLPTGKDAVGYWAERLGPCAGAILQTLVAVHPSTIDRATLAEVTGYSETSSGFSAALTKLRKMGLVEGTRASDDLMGLLRP